MRYATLWTALVVAGVLALPGCKNDNLFGSLHREGSGDPTALIADGQAALQQGDYAKALDYFNNALAKDASRSEALYGAAVAEMGLAGLDIGQLIANIIKGDSTGTTSLIAQAVIRPSAGDDPSSFLYLINADALNARLRGVVCKLERIRSGMTDGVIAGDDPNLLINMSISRLLLAAVRVYVEPKLIDFRQSDDSYEAEIVGDYASHCGQVIASANDVIGAYQLADQAIRSLNIVSEGTLNDIKNDVNALYTSLKTQVGSCTLPVDVNVAYPEPACGATPTGIR